MAGLTAKNISVGIIIPSLVVSGFWDKNTIACASAMPFHRDCTGHYQDREISSKTSAGFCLHGGMIISVGMVHAVQLPSEVTLLWPRKKASLTEDSR